MFKGGWTRSPYRGHDTKVIRLSGFARAPSLSEHPSFRVSVQTTNATVISGRRPPLDSVVWGEGIAPSPSVASRRPQANVPGPGCPPTVSVAYEGPTPTLAIPCILTMTVTFAAPSTLMLKVGFSHAATVRLPNPSHTAKLRIELMVSPKLEHDTVFRQYPR